MEFLNILFIIILVIIALRLLVRYVFPFLLLRYFKKKQDEFMGKMQDDKKQHRKPGEVNVDYKPDPSKRSKLDDVGEYTDFEEVDDDK
jgi:hypothetical protein